MWPTPKRVNRRWPQAVRAIRRAPALSPAHSGKTFTSGWWRKRLAASRRSSGQTLRHRPA